MAAGFMRQKEVDWAGLISISLDNILIDTSLI